MSLQQWERLLLVRMALNGVSNPWAVFVEALVARENIPTWDRICDDFV